MGWIRKRLTPRPRAIPPPGRLRPGDRALLTAEIILAYVPLLRQLRRNDLTTMVAAARSPLHPRFPTPPARAHESAVQLGIIVQRILGLLPTDNRCLIRSLVLLRLLDQRSIPATIVIGVQGGAAFAAHAWIEHDGVAVLPDNGFERLLDL